MIKRKRPDGKLYQFKDGTSEQEMADAFTSIYNKPDAEAPADSLSAGDVAIGAVTSFPSSVAGVAGDIYTAITNPADTAFGLGQLVAGTVQNIGLKAGEAILPEGKTKEEVMAWMGDDVSNQRQVSIAVAEFYADRYGSLEGFKKALATDPASVMADAATVLTGGAGAATKAGLPLKAAQTLKQAASYVDPIMLTARGATAATKGLGASAKQALGLATGAGPESIGQAFKSGVEGGQSGESLRGAMRGTTPIDEIVDIAKQDLQNMKINKNAQYKKSLEALKVEDKVIGFDGIDSSLGKAFDVVTYKGEVKNKKGYDAVLEASSMVDEWKSLDSAQFHTPEGVDALKQKISSIIDSIPYEERQARMAVTSIKSAIDKEIKAQAPAYARMMKEYAESASLIKEIERALSLSDRAAADTSIRKLQSLMRNNASTNYGKRLDLAKTLEQEGGGQIMPLAAGQSLQDWAPRGIQRGVAPVGGFGAFSVGGLPAVAGYAAASSPRLIGEAAHAAGRAGGGISRATQGILGMIPDIDFQQALNLAYQSQQPKEQR